MAKRLGLHVGHAFSAPDDVLISSSAQEERQAVFWACFRIDRYEKNPLYQVT
jgi:hypothetical protein